MIKSLTASFALLLAAAAVPALADSMIYNVNGIQVGPDGKLHRFGGLVIDDNGKVAEIFQRTEDLNRPIEHEIDGQGRTLLPGLIDAHGHVMGLGFSALQLDLTGTSSLADLQARLKAYAAANPDARWIVGRGWNQELWPQNERVFPTSADLDAVVSDRPVVLTRVDGHALVANSAALNAAGVTADTKAPEGGRIENGLFVDAAMPLIESAIPVPTPAEYDAARAKAQELLLSVGLTAAADMGTSLADWQAMNRASNARTLHLRVLVYAAGTEALTAMEISPSPGRFLDERVPVVGVKLYSDGALGSRGALLKRPYADAPQTSGLAVTDPATLRAQAGHAAAGGYQVAIHAIGDRANAEAIGIFEQLGAQHGRDRRWRIEHFQIADPIDIPRLKPSGIIASMQPVHQTSDRLMAEKRLGPDRLKGAYAWQTVAKLGIPLAFGSDFPVENPNPFPGLAAAISRQDMNGQPPGGWIPEERVTFEQALYGFTRGAAYASFAEGRIGSLEPGKWADFILVDRDVSKADPQALARTQVLETWVAGKKVWERSPSAGAERGR